jgi:CDP-glucose 4,6-dehydratase
MFDNIYQGKKVLITGHTGFKGAWLTTWLLNLDSNVVGVSKDIPTEPSMFSILELSNNIKNVIVDIRNFELISQVVLDEKPDFVFHLAAQAIVSTSYSNPLETVSSNVMGTTNLLESLRISNHQCTAVIITSDKAYDNVEQIWGYKENDQMGGKDVYSGSKGAAELITKSYYHSFFKLKESNVRLAVARAGNVIGGGDWAKDRIVVDAVSAWSQGERVEIRSPQATRPWQHVLEPLSGYLHLGKDLYNNKELNGEGFNFGPRAEQNRTVKELLSDLSSYWNFNKSSDAFIVIDNISFYEATLLKLNCDKSLSLLKWQSTLDYHDTIRFTSEWYYGHYKNCDNMMVVTIKQIFEYENIAKSKGLRWTV